MDEGLRIPLTPHFIGIRHREFNEITRWPFADPFVLRLLKTDVPQRIQFEGCELWIYRDPAGELVGFGTFMLCHDFREYTGGLPHLYIPLLAVNPEMLGRGHGVSIVHHLVDHAAIALKYHQQRFALHDMLFLDVYETSTAAISLYNKCGFVKIIDDPIPDQDEVGKRYFIMGKRVSIQAQPFDTT